MATGRFAPSPTGDLHLGNLRTALLAWLFARSAGSAFLVRMEDLDRVQAEVEHEARQLADLGALGLDHDGAVVRQSDRFPRYEAAIDRLTAAGLTYPCYCTRREIRDAAAAPHAGPAPDGAYPGTCRDLGAAARADVGEVTVVDDLLGPVTALVDDVVLRRNDGVPAYNLAVVVDDAAQGVEQVVRGDDLATSAPRQRYLAGLLDLPPVRYAHVPLVLGPGGERLAKRDGAVTLAELAAIGLPPARVLARLGASLGLCAPDEDVTAPGLANRFDPAAVPRRPWRIDPTGWVVDPAGPANPTFRTIGQELDGSGP